MQREAETVTHEAAATRDPDLCVVTCALTGVLANRKQCPHIPYTPGRDRARRPSAPTTRAPRSCTSTRATTTGRPTFSPADLRAASRRRCGSAAPSSSTSRPGTILDDVTEQCTYIRESRPEIAALNMGTMNYSKYSEKRKAFVFDMVFPNTYAKIIKLLAAMNEAGVKPELECFDTGHTQGVWPLARHGRAQAAAPVLVHRQRARRHPAARREPPAPDADHARPGSEWEVIGISHCQWRMLATALVLGGNIRVRARGQPLPAERRDGEVATASSSRSPRAWCATSGRRPATVERGAADPRPRGARRRDRARVRADQGRARRRASRRSRSTTRSAGTPSARR